MKTNFASRVLRWFDQHGRHDLPWQKKRTLYRVWVSEIMLQQTQVKTVIPYYKKFMQRFPDVKRLAGASQDEVLQYWAGLGYYSRGRNLHKAAQLIAEQHGGRVPRTPEALIALPGIGRSTAAAILSQALDQRQVILDGNVKRVLSRYRMVEGWPGNKAVEQQLWHIAEELTPSGRNADYTQAIMDMGATLCTRSKPACDDCPVSKDCMALAADDVGSYPAKKPKKVLPVKQTRLLILIDQQGAILLEKRPPSGIWGGLWSLPEVDPQQDIATTCQQRWGLELTHHEESPVFRHSFSHYHLDIRPSRCQIVDQKNAIRSEGELMWCKPQQTDFPAVAAPVAKLLAAVHD